MLTEAIGAQRERSLFARLLRKRSEQILSRADIQINGTRPRDIVVHREGFFARVFRQGSLGLGESYMDGWWDCPSLDQFFDRLFRAGIEGSFSLSWRAIWLYLTSLLSNPQRKSRRFQIGKGHYDFTSDLFEGMLDRRMVYTCGYWNGASNLDQAQEAKLEFVCRELGLQPGMSVLDIGCGWGSFAKYAAEKHGVSVVGITISKQQARRAAELCRGLPIEIRLQDYRDADESFDRVVSLGMFEHVGCKNYRTFMRLVRRSLRQGGRFYLSTIGKNYSVRMTDPWIEKYIFPNSMLPSIRQIGASIERLFLMEKWQNWGPHYDRTLMAWFGNFHRNCENLCARYGERFCRMWRFYLMASAGAFRSRNLQAWQIVLAPFRRGEPIDSFGAPDRLQDMKRRMAGTRLSQSAFDSSLRPGL